MGTTYFLFGLEASAIYIESNDIDTYEDIAKKIKTTDFDVCVFTPNNTGIELVEASMGWSDYCVINQEMYNLLSK